MARRGEAQARVRPHDVPMQSRYVSGVTIRPLRNGDTPTVAAAYARAGGSARRPCGAELAALARVDATRHVLVAYLDGDPEPAGIARLLRDGPVGQIAIAVACRGRGVGSVLARALAADARAAGITELVEPAVSMLARPRQSRERAYATSWTASTPGS
jgi:GNAT superfamily N-acetyltransferase